MKISDEQKALIQKLHADHPELLYRQIADIVGVSRSSVSFILSCKKRKCEIRDEIFEGVKRQWSTKVDPILPPPPDEPAEIPVPVQVLKDLAVVINSIIEGK